ncbi:MAG: bifunctional diaminohydroxyphosphoribosylaminopyrimidine deaminase/5-amino-6-(5-phosphoribosylamino)uracil reductase RibD [Candidatus Pacearchaeota archaeon]
MKSSVFTRLKFLSLSAMRISSPNPPVGAVITDLEGNILAEGFTQESGGNHAEREAYKNFKENIPHEIYITLEPCTHFGKTPPCIDLLLEKRPKKVYLGIRDPNPLIQLRDGIYELQKAGIEVEFNANLQKISRAFLGGFLKRIIKQKPKWFIKVAVSKEGYYTNKERDSFRMTSQETDNFFQALRSRMDAIVVGPYTTYKDSPSLDYRGYTRYENSNSTVVDVFYSAFYDSIYSNETIPIPDDTHQPYRVFVISSKTFPSKEFFEKQNQINQRTQTKKCIFFALETLSPEQEKQLLELTNIPIQYVDESSLKEKLESFLYSLGCLHVLIEGGNLLYKMFTSDIDYSDEIILIHTQTSISKGIIPKIPFTKMRIRDRFTISNDTINILYR